MKITILYTFLISILFISFSSCKDHKSVNQSLNTIDVSKLDSIAFKKFEIDSALAIKCIDLYQGHVETIKNNSKDPILTSKLSYGAEVNLRELRRILWAADTIDDKLYAMLAVMPNDSTEIIFTLRTIDTIESKDTLERRETNVTTIDTTWTFFDFTQACPTSCPSL